MDITQHLAITLKILRQARGWSLSKLAEETGVSKAMLGQVERNESSPTVSTLWKIATGLNVPFSTFISPEAGPQPVFDPKYGGRNNIIMHMDEFLCKLSAQT
jgi:transcriptional regulator with XRE-family HTH domain